MLFLLAVPKEIIYAGEYQIEAAILYVRLFWDNSIVIYAHIPNASTLSF